MSFRTVLFLVFTLFFTIHLSSQEIHWETPRLFSPQSGSFPVADYQGNFSAIAWQETSPNAGGAGGRIRVNLAVRQGIGSWITRSGIAEYNYSGATEPAILNIALNARGRILIAVAASATETDILISDDLGATFAQNTLEMGSETSVAPRIFTRTDGGYLLFVTRGIRRESLSLFYSRSDNGIDWSAFQPFVTEQGQMINLLPSHASFNGQEYVIYQSQISGDLTFQLFLKSSRDNGRSWSNSVRITNFRDPFYQNTPPDQFDNQRVHLSVQRNRLFAVWERRHQGGPPQIYAASLNTNGSIFGAPDRVNFDNAYCNNPIAFEHRGMIMVTWFDNSQGTNRIMLSFHTLQGWERGSDISRLAGGEASFGRPLINGDNLVVFWQTTRQNQNNIFSITPDTSFIQPQLLARNFTPGRRTTNNTAIIGWEAPRSGGSVRGYSWSWSRNPAELPPRNIMSSTTMSGLEQVADQDGIWYFTLISQNFLDEWSEPVRITFIRDSTPPPISRIISPETDDNGFLVSNSFTMQWNIPPGSDVMGYTWNLQYLGSALLVEGFGEELNRTAAERFASLTLPPRTLMGPENSASFANQDNGLWVFTVSAVDEAGNIGLPAHYFFKTNKYIPFTNISFADTYQDENGNTLMRILGRGFTEDGLITRVILDRDGLEPYDWVFNHNEDFQIQNDREISGLIVTDIPSGVYRILLEHTRRGMYVSPPIISVDQTGTIKFGDFSQTWQPSWTLRQQRTFTLDTTFLALLLILTFCILGFFVSVRGLSAAAAESAAIRMETIALLTGDIMPSEKKRRMTRIKRRGGGLRLKMASFTIALVTSVTAMIASPLYVMMGRTQEATLLQGLYDRTGVLLESIATNARVFMPASNYLELGYLPSQVSAIPEAYYVTITGHGEEQTIFSDYVLATNDLSILSKINTSELEIGHSRLSDSLSPRIPGIEREMNEQASEEIGDIARSISEVAREAFELMENPFSTAADRQRIEEIGIITQTMQNRVMETLYRIGGEIGSEPEFSTQSLKENTHDQYIFFKPILYRLSSDEIFYRGMVRLELSIEPIVQQIRVDRRNILIVILTIALAANIVGVIGALIMSTLIVRPITRLVSHVERIRDTEDKTKLDGVDIVIKSKDEIAVLGNTINEMTQGLVKAAIAASDLSLGKEIQKKFIPLEVNRDGNKLTSGFKDTKNVQFFGYYEGAKGVSGDYFDYQDLDGRYFALIKCDVAGKGIPAALIMIQVATMFLGYFRRWKPTEKGMHIEDLVYQINDFIETMGFKGRFAAFTLCLFDSHTGLLRFCNAGDNIIHWYDASERKMKTVTFRETPATGVLPNFLVESKGGYSVQTLNIDRGDILFLFTDGIEEGKRRFRNAAFEDIICEEGERDTPHANHIVGQADEEMGPDRVEAIINAAMNKEVYTLHKYHNPEGENHDLQFDFTNCEGRVEEAIMAMVSVEKIFRMYKDPKATADSRVLVDKKVDEFLRKHFRQYRDYCYYTLENPGNDAYMYYTHVKEDEQYDDLTILGVNWK